MFFTNIDYRNRIEIVGDITILPKSISEIDLRLENEKNSVPSELAPLLALSSFFTACIRASAPNKFRKSILSHEVSRNELRIPSFPQPSFPQEMLAGIGLKKLAFSSKKLPISPVESPLATVVSHLSLHDYPLPTPSSGTFPP